MAPPKSSTQWLRSRRCESGSCVEVAKVGDQIAMRDSKDPNSPILLFTGAEWDAFVEGVQAGDFQFS